MAEGVGVDAVMGPDGEVRDTEGGAVGPDAVAVAVALDAAAEHPTVAADASAFLQSQKRLVDLQVKHFDEERCLAIAAAKRKRYSDRHHGTWRSSSRQPQLCKESWSSLPSSWSWRRLD
jgi:hypothetical protein